MEIPDSNCQVSDPPSTKLTAVPRVCMDVGLIPITVGLIRGGSSEQGSTGFGVKIVFILSDYSGSVHYRSL